jgi:subtilase family serine protease
MRHYVKLLVVIFVGIFLASSFASMAHGNNLVSINTGFDTRLLAGQQIGVPDQNVKIDISIALKIRNEQQLDSYLAQVENINSPMFHKFLTKDQFVQMYSPGDYEFNVVYNYFKSQGVDVSAGPYHLAIFLNNVPIWKAEQIFHIKFGLFKSNNPHFKDVYFAPLTPVQLPYNIAQYIKGISGLTNAYKYHINVKLQNNFGSNFINSNGVQLISGADLQKAYQVVQLYNGSASAASSSTHYFPTGYTIATILWEGTDSSGNQVAPYNPTDIQTYFKNVLPAWEQQIVGTISVTGKGTSGTVAPGSSASNDANGVNVENTLDLEMVGTLAPGASLVCVYGPGGSGGGPSETNFPDPEYAIAAGLSNLIAVSNSWGDGDTTTSATTDNYVKQMEATGTSVFASSGDDGDTTTQSNPANDAQNTFGFVAVGGTTLTLNGNAGYYNGAGTPLTNVIKKQVVWYDTIDSPNSNGDYWGTTSGVSSAYPTPSWQNIPAVINNGGSTSGRNVADIAAIANNTLIYVNGAWNSVGGTSVASPVVAGIVASMSAYLNQKFGFIDPLLYKIGANETTYSLKPFFDVTQNPPGYHNPAKVGWDFPTGWGTFYAWNFTQIVKGGSSTPTTYTVTFTESGLPSGTSWSVTFNGNTKSSTTTTISYTGIANGSYSYTVGSVSGYTASPSSGTITVNGANVNQAITFTASSSTTTVKVYSYVNSSSISTYSLPEAEAFTVGSSTVNVNFVTLYLSGSGSIKFSIGTSLWKADVLANTTVSVSSGKLWYNTTIPTISLTGGKTYYLNVYQASGSVQWGYTSSPSSSSKNYVQDYWYSSGTLYHDNSYPNIYTIGYKPTTSITGHDQNYNVPKIVLPLNIKNNAKNVPELFNLSLVLATPATRNIF